MPSFHANIGQVVIWGTQLQTYAASRAKNDDDEVFKALGPILQLIKRCLEREPEERLSSADLERRLGDYISTFAGVEHLHCVPESAQPTPKIEFRSRSETRPMTERSLAPTMEEGAPHITGKSPPLQRDQWSQLRSRGLTTTTIPSPGPESSLSSLSSFNFEYDVQSDTIVEEDRSVLSDSTDQHRHNPIDSQELAHRLLIKTRPGWSNWHETDSRVDPKLTVQPNSTAFSYAKYSASESSEAEDGVSQQGGSFLLPPTRPSSMHPASMECPAPPPTKALPAAPNSSKQRIQHKPGAAYLPPQRSSPQGEGRSLLKTVAEDDGQALNLGTSKAPHERRIKVLGKGASFLKNI